MKNTLMLLLVLTSLQSCLEAERSSTRQADPGLPPIQRQINPDGTLPTGSLLSQAFRLEISYGQQTENLINEENDKYQLIPFPEQHNESLISKVGNIANDCGVDQELSGINDRITDCTNKNPNGKTIWEGSQRGISGEGLFALVQKSGKKLLWLDQTTGLIWSYRLDDSPWKQASGADMDITDEEFACNAIRSLPSTEVVFRLPTRNDYLIADVNGARYVLPDTDQSYWTATSIDGSTKAWGMNLAKGQSIEASTDDHLAVRCVGHVLKQE